MEQQAGADCGRGLDLFEWASESSAQGNHRNQWRHAMKDAYDLIVIGGGTGGNGVAGMAAKAGWSVGFVG